MEVQLIYDENTKVVVHEKSAKASLKEYPSENKYPPFWRDFSSLCLKTEWEQHLGMYFFNNFKFLAARCKIVTAFKKYTLEYIAFGELHKLEGIMGSVVDRSGYKIDCIVTCENKYTHKFSSKKEFIFIGGSTVAKGSLIFIFCFLFNFRFKYLFDDPGSRCYHFY